MDDILFYSGDSRNLVITVTNADNEPVDLTGASIEWILINQNNAVLTKSVGLGITINNPTGGQFTIALTIKDTRPLSGTYQHMARVTTSNENSSIVLTGTINVTKAFI